MSDKSKLTLSALLFITGLVIYILPSHWLADSPQLADQYQLMAIGVGILLAAVIFWFTDSRVSFQSLLKGARNEILKVVWPTRQETVTFTTTVVIFALVVALYCWVADKGIEALLYQWVLNTQ